MENTVNSRILLLKTKSNLENQEFCAKCNIAVGTLWNIQNGDNVSSKTIRSIATALNANPDWIKTGKGKTYLSEPLASSNTFDPATDTLYKELRDQIAFYRQLLMQVTGGKAASFLQALNGTGLRKRRSLGAAA